LCGVVLFFKFVLILSLQVIEFLKEYPSAIAKLEDDIVVGKYSKEARNKMEWLNTLKNTAAQCVKVDQWDQAIDKIEEAKTKLEELNVEPFNTKIQQVWKDYLLVLEY
jgi:hypothetical protein